MAISRHAHKINSCQKKCHRGRGFFFLLDITIISLEEILQNAFFSYCRWQSNYLFDTQVFFLYFLNKKVERIVKLYSLANSMEICVTFHLIGKKNFTFYFTYILWFWLDSMFFPLCRIHLFLTDRYAVKCVIKKPFLFFVWIQWKLVKL